MSDLVRLLDHSQSELKGFIEGAHREPSDQKVRMPEKFDEVDANIDELRGVVSRLVVISQQQTALLRRLAQE
jgi:hypothetical protein